MRTIFYAALILATLAMVSCSTGKLATTSKTSAETYENSGDYAQALTAWTQYFSQISVEETSGAEFAHAAQTAFKAGNSTQAIAWYDQARYKDYANADMYETLAKIYRADDNLSKELSALETYTDKYGTENKAVNARLFSIYSEIEDNAKALKYWSLMDDAAHSEQANLMDYFIVNKAVENTAVCDSLATVLLKLNPDETEALDWLAKKYYRAGQDRYDREMKKYEANKTRKQYNILLKELDQVTVDFKKALPYLEKLWKKNPSKEYASYFANIYARFGDEKKVEYYKSKMK